LQTVTRARSRASSRCASEAVDLSRGRRGGLTRLSTTHLLFSSGVTEQPVRTGLTAGGRRRRRLPLASRHLSIGCRGEYYWLRGPSDAQHGTSSRRPTWRYTFESTQVVLPPAFFLGHPLALFGAAGRPSDLGAAPPGGRQRICRRASRSSSPGVWGQRPSERAMGGKGACLDSSCSRTSRAGKFALAPSPTRWGPAIDRQCPSRWRARRVTGAELSLGQANK